MPKKPITELYCPWCNAIMEDSNIAHYVGYKCPECDAATPHITVVSTHVLSKPEDYTRDVGAYLAKVSEARQAAIAKFLNRLGRESRSIAKFGAERGRSEEPSALPLDQCHHECSQCEKHHSFNIHTDDPCNGKKPNDEQGCLFSRRASDEGSGA